MKKILVVALSVALLLSTTACGTNSELEAKKQKNEQLKQTIDELKKDLEGISQKVLTDSLRSMEEDGIITRTVYAEVPPRVEYALSELGESMRPIIKSMEEWGISYKNMQ